MIVICLLSFVNFEFCVIVASRNGTGSQDSPSNVQNTDDWQDQKLPT